MKWRVVIATGQNLSVAGGCLLTSCWIQEPQDPIIEDAFILARMFASYSSQFRWIATIVYVNESSSDEPPRARS